MFISSVRVTNFRSLVDLHVDFTVYTALVGLNDAGKSNVLRALNLFFNQETDIDEPLVFERDFSQKARVGKKKAREIVIELELQPPAHYRDSDAITWRKVYRAGQQTPFPDEIRRKDGKPFSPNSKVNYWARNLAFEYVPAVRGRPFFNILKRRLHAALAATVAEKLKEASGMFLEGLRAEVAKIEQDSLRLLDLRTEFSLPEDLGDLFEALEFSSSDVGVLTALHNRGDGVQGRHVPLILKFLAEQRKKNSAKGKPAPETIWGFEEPENNLELAKQVEVAREFGEYAQDVQIVVSTHSPAFYKVAKDSESGSIQFAARIDGRTQFRDEPLPEAVDGTLGLMPFVEPYLDRAEVERQKVLEALSQLRDEGLLYKGNALFIEGSSDQVILLGALQVMEIQLDAKIEVVEGRGGGANWVADRCIARAALADVSGKTVALLDDDDAGRAAAERIRMVCEALGRAGRVKCIFVGRDNGDDHVRAIKQSGMGISWALDELCDPFDWGEAEGKGWLQPRTDELLKLNFQKLGGDMTMVQLIEARVASEAHRRIVANSVIPERKMAFARAAADTMAVLGYVPPSLERLIKQLQEVFSQAR
ncbi:MULTISPECIES: ATP-dependent nuclease [unclassified Stenotrophomonas]|uniref:ATP-dependent nuclease n=1 Tax=unclassified Stenotrophomonas TaxID=196198 RepID=UPI001EBD0D6D|nr:AAA family ATPase [Stenotrophomonas maltophilia]